MSNIIDRGALITRIGFSGQIYYTVLIIRNPQNSIGIYFDPYSSVFSITGERTDMSEALAVHMAALASLVFGTAL